MASATKFLLTFKYHVFARMKARNIKAGLKEYCYCLTGCTAVEEQEKEEEEDSKEEEPLKVQKAGLW